jgi:hypothetical protein
MLFLNTQADDFREHRHGNGELYARVPTHAAQKFFSSLGKMLLLLRTSRLWSMTAYRKISESTAIRIVLTAKSALDFSYHRFFFLFGQSPNHSTEDIRCSSMRQRFFVAIDAMSKGGS